MGAANFWGTETQYKNLHRWLNRVAGRADECEQADATCKGKFEWANRSGDYIKSTEDWIRLCRSHHRRYDDAASSHAILRPKTHCKRGHKFTPENTRIVDTGRGRTAKRCIECQRKAWRDKYHQKKGLV